MSGRASLALHRGDVDDPSAPARDHRPRRRLPDIEHGVEIGRHQLAPRLGLELLQRRAALDARVVDENVERADLGLDPGHRLADFRVIGHVERGAERLQPLPVQSSTAASTLAPSRPLMTTVAPAAPKARASASPIPPDEPVTSAICLSSENNCCRRKFKGVGLGEIGSQP